MSKVAVVVSTRTKCIDLPGTKDSLASHTASSVGFDTIPGTNNDAIVVLCLVAIITNEEAAAIRRVAHTAEAELEMIVGRVVSVVEEEHLLAVALFLQTKAALGAAGIGVHVDRRNVEVCVGLGDDVEPGVVRVVDSTNMKLLRNVVLIAAVEFDGSAFFELITVDIHTEINRILGHSLDLNNIVVPGDVIRTVGAVREVTVMGIATDDGSVPALHRIVGTDNRWRTLVDPCTSMRINLCIVAIPAHMGLLVARRALSGPLTIMLFGPGPATIPTLVLLLATFCAMAFPSARIGILFDDAPIPARLPLWGIT
mmetsp:Transcript_31270/g.91579  ORF Transcript_31270/g.91579 Transcript_31270/m.91579 type:complete len:312 (-) Transcript_31270:702-1637(-)